jgi:hypothetical protein
MYPKSNNNLSDDPAEIPSTPIQRRTAPLPAKPRKRLILRSSSIASSDISDYAKKSPPPPSLKNRTAARDEADSIRSTRIKALDEPLVKKQKGRMTFNSACAADDLSPFAPDHNANSTPPMVATSPLSSPPASLSDSSVSDTSSPSPEVVIMTKKRKLEEINNSKDIEFTAVSKRKKRDESEWEPVHKSYSRRKVDNKSQYRCTLCLEKNGKLHLCNREGDMARHLQSLIHTPKSFFCPNSGCSKNFTRQDALKRHLNKCRA